jgi:hypothetical protein
MYGLLVCPWYAYSQTMIAEVSPLPQMFVIASRVPMSCRLTCYRFLFFALFSVIGKTSAFIGPFVSEAIITASGNNNNMPFAFLFGLYALQIPPVMAGRLIQIHSGVFSTVFLLFVDMDKSRAECDAFVAAEAKHEAFIAEVPC